MSAIKKTILSVVGNKLLSPAEVVQAEFIGKNFRKITLAADSFGSGIWRPGEKIQINVGNWNVRTYTPLSIDSARGHLEVLAYLHGQGPGSDWAQSVRAGESCQFIGPRPSLEIEPQARSILIFGDETSMPMAATFQNKRSPVESAKYLFEVSSLDSCDPVTETLNLQKASLFQKSGSDLPDELLQVLRASVSNGNFDKIILTGNAKSIQRLRGELKALDFPLSQVKVKVYWAAGKAGID